MDEQPTEPPAAPTAEQEVAATVEAILFASDSPLSAGKIARTGELGGERAVRDAVEHLNARYDELGSAFRIEQIAGGYQMMTRPEYHDVLGRLLSTRSEAKLSSAAMETLAIVAYRQPILRADVEAIRGVACGDMLRGLMDKALVKIVGRAEVLGRPMLYGTTRRFLEVFGLNSLEDLPRVEELRSGAGEQTPATQPAGEDQTDAGEAEDTSSD
jgi:segregation and condensation protein B